MMEYCPKNTVVRLSVIRHLVALISFNWSVTAKAKFPVTEHTISRSSRSNALRKEISLPALVAIRISFPAARS